MGSETDKKTVPQREAGSDPRSRSEREDHCADPFPFRHQNESTHPDYVFEWNATGGSIES